MLILVETEKDVGRVGEDDCGYRQAPRRRSPGIEKPHRGSRFIPLILPLPSHHSAIFFPFLTSLQIRSKADPALAEAEELLNAEEEMEAAAI